MAVGDVISDITTQVGAYSYLVPSSGVEIIITWVPSGDTSYIFMYDGAVQSSWFNISALPSNGLNMKFGITNSNYLGIYGTGLQSGYSGIQTK